MFFTFDIQDVLSLFFGESILLCSVFFILSYNIYYSNGRMTKGKTLLGQGSHLGTVFLAFLGLAFYFLMLLVSGGLFGFSYSNQFFRMGCFENWVLIGVLVLSIIILFLGKHYLEREKLYSYEYYILFLLYVVGAAVLLKSVSLISVYLGIEIIGLTSYVLAAYKRYSEYSVEAGLKYFVLGVFGSAFFLLSAGLLYLVCGTLDVDELSMCVRYLFLGENAFLALYSTSTIAVVLLIGAFLLKLGIAPFHVWVPDVYEGSPTVITLLFSVLPKVVFFTFLMKLFLLFLPNDNSVFLGILYAMCVLSILMGTFLALFQARVKRFFAYSSIVHAGYLLLVVLNQTASSLAVFFFYLTYYLVALIGIFSVVLSLRTNPFDLRVKYLSELGGLWQVRPMLALGLTVFLCSFAGIPPLVGFLGKMYVLYELLEGSLFFLSVIVVLSSVLGAVYYLYLIRLLYFGRSSGELDSLYIAEAPAYVFSTALCLLILGLFYVEQVFYSCGALVFSLMV